MTALESETKFRLATVRNLLFLVTGLLVVIGVSLAILQLGRAGEAESRAERAKTLSELIGEMETLKFSVSGERLNTITAYGLPDAAPDVFTRKIIINRGSVENSYDNITEALKVRPEFDGADENPQRFAAANRAFTTASAAFREAYDTYVGLHDTIDSDLSGGAKTSSTRSVTRAMDGLIDATAALRQQIETNYDYGDDRIGTVNRMKYQLWVMLEYAAREAAALGANVASGSPISDIQKDRGSRFGGQGQNAWAQVQAIAASATATPEIAAQVEEIQTVFFDEFAETRFELYDLSDEAVDDAEDEDEDVTVDYERSPEEWVESAESASEPVNKMSRFANQLAEALNNEAVSAAGTAAGIAWGLIVGVVLIALASGWVVLYRVLRPVNALSDTMMVLADGNLEVEIPNAEDQNEIGDMARSVQVFKENAIERQKMEAQAREQEEADRKRQEEEEERKRQEEEEQRKREDEQAEQARADRRTAMLDLADSFESKVMGIVEGVSGSAQEMESAASGMASTADDTSQKSNVVANAAQQASSNAQMVASAAEELSASVREITGQTTQSSAAARDAVGRTENASKDIAELVDAAQKIGDVVKLINDIAEQTNLLALNATIEAARAGDAGKGFAVVASEVKSLANQTAKATQEISEQVDGMQQATNTAVSAMDQIKSIIGEIESTSVSIASAVEEQDASTQEIARNVSEVSTGTEEVTSNIHAVNEGATSTGSAATEVLSAAQLLTQQSDELRSQVEDFLKTIRS
jgi:methyl-accepting chemotaxis protein